MTGEYKQRTRHIGEEMGEAMTDFIPHILIKTNTTHTIGVDKITLFKNHLTFRDLMSAIADVTHRQPPKFHFIYLFNKYGY